MEGKKEKRFRIFLCATLMSNENKSEEHWKKEKIKINELKRRKSIEPTELSL